MTQSLLLTSEYEFTLQMYTFIASDEIVVATHIQIRITLQMNMFIASDKGVLYWGQTLLALQTKALCAGDEQVENVRLSFSHRHTQLPAPSKQTYV